MWSDPEHRELRRRGPISAHVIVVGNEKGGSGKSTTAMHLAVALMKAGQRVATIDLDSRQSTLTHYVERRRLWGHKINQPLDIPLHFCIARSEGARVDENEAAEFGRFADAITEIEHRHDFLVIDTPGADTFLSRLAHSMADTLVTPLNDSFLDFDVLAAVDPQTFEITGASHYAELVREARRQRRIVDGKVTDWVVVRNRLSTLGSRNRKLVAEGLNVLSGRFGFRFVEGFAERVIYREFFPRGLTAIDDIGEQTLGTRPSLSHVTARLEVQGLLSSLRLPLDDRGRKRAEARAEWFMSAYRPLDTDDLLDDGLGEEKGPVTLPRMPDPTSPVTR
ncbi:division plane positioning ATPase MipZ [Rhodoplanes sp. TEM]|uniref:Division plane positioning ATPase MipZ n=1 Tax=Rhodoplanes tepidamans TaxID=200616 RepID=A0ABT5J9V5_RHOTP|nr:MULTISPECIES: division plane positioning ATPase MipZ [Rhodoplanes]MDC7785855.1 division plane positioning ATPase MipZ [Rhodoplanes tepidamans]MDC7988046.1 division plane positioning ATPase MipZ [Rhodoplanes sp. TEM]MDQ0357398.1 chromosome partitioning protein [Rhodoplanes tepidamans]